MNCRKEFEAAYFALLSHFPFYGALLAGCKVSFTERMPTAYVTILATGDIEMGINPHFFLSLSAEHRVGLILHELNHLMLKHLHRTKSMGLNPKLSNIAQDVELNQYIPKPLLPPGALVPATFKLPEGLNFEKYYVLLSQLQQQQQQGQVQIKIKVKGGKGGKGDKGDKSDGPFDLDDYHTLDEHDLNQDQSTGKKNAIDDGSMSANGSMSVGEMQSPEATAQVIDNAVKNARAKAGNCPAHIERMLEEMNRKVKTPWQLLLRKFIGRNTSALMESTRTRANRRVGLMAEGYKNEYSPKILVGVDQSGSVSDEALVQFAAEMQKIVGVSNDKVTIAFFDTEVSNVVRISDAKKVPKKRFRSGGTDFNAIVNLARKERPDLLIILTDGEAPNPRKVERLPLLWAIVPSSPESDLSEFAELTGQKIKIELEEKAG